MYAEDRVCTEDMVRPYDVGPAVGLLQVPRSEDHRRALYIQQLANSLMLILWCKIYRTWSHRLTCEVADTTCISVYDYG